MYSVHAVRLTDRNEEGNTLFPDPSSGPAHVPEDATKAPPLQELDILKEDALNIVTHPEPPGERVKL